MGATQLLVCMGPSFVQLFTSRGPGFRARGHSPSLGRRRRCLRRCESGSGCCRPGAAESARAAGEAAAPAPLAPRPQAWAAGTRSADRQRPGTAEGRALLGAGVWPSRCRVASRPRAPASPQPCWEPRPAPRTAPRKPESPWTGPSGFPGHQQVHPRAVSPVCPSLPPCRLQRPQPLSPRPRPPWRPLCSPWNLKAARLIAFGHQVSRRPAST